MTGINLGVTTPTYQSSSSPIPNRSLAPEQEADSQSPSRSTGTSARPSEKSTKSALLKKIQNQDYGSPISNQQTHAKNVANVYEAVEDFIDEFFFHNPHATGVELRTAVSENMGAILNTAQVDKDCYQVRGSGVEEYGKHLLFSTIGMKEFEGAPLCFQLFRFNPGQKIPVRPEQKTGIHTHPNPEQDPERKQTLLVECASYVLAGTVSERHYLPDPVAGTARKIRKDHRDNNRRAVDNPGTNPPHSIKNIGDVPAYTVHGYTMDGISAGQTAAVQTFFKKAPNLEVYEAYNSLVDNIVAGKNSVGEAIPTISAADAVDKLRAGSQARKQIVVDIREPKERLKAGALNIDGADMLFVPRGIAFTEILGKIPDPENTEVILCCRDGSRSALLANDLLPLGYRAVSVSDGIRGFGQLGLLKKHDEDALPSDDEPRRNLAPEGKLAKHIEHIKATLPEGIAAIDAQELAQGMEDEKFTLFDVRQEDERKDGVIPNAQRVEAGKIEMKAKLHAPDFEKPIVIYSDGDGDYRALTAAINLREMGYANVKFLEGGYASYKAAGS
jgi:rhodanese-related sulfurtransferase